MNMGGLIIWLGVCSIAVGIAGIVMLVLAIRLLEAETAELGTLIDSLRAMPPAEVPYP